MSEADQMRFRFSIRDLLWLTLAVALAVGWWVDHCNQRRQIDALVDPPYVMRLGLHPELK